MEKCVLWISLALLLLPNMCTAAPVTVPAFLWSNGGSLVTSSPVHYDVQTTDQLASSLFQKPSSETDADVALSTTEGPDVVLAFLSSNGQLLDLALSSSKATSFPKDAFLSASISTAFSFVTRGSGEGQGSSMASSLLASFRKSELAGESVLMGSCEVASFSPDLKVSSAEQLKEYIMKRSGTKREGMVDLVIVCGSEVSSRTPEEALETEEEEFTSVYSALTGEAKKYVAIYTWSVDNEAVASLSSARRQMAQAGEGDVGRVRAGPLTCGPVCRTKATLLEVLLVGLILLITLVSGLACLAAVDTPSKFEVARES